MAFSNTPTGPFTDGQPVDVGEYNEIDPDVFIDDDGQAYYLWGQFSLKMAKMNPDMVSLDSSSIRDNVLTEEQHHFHEGAFMCKIGELYYLVYADISRGDAPTCLGYATSEDPFGPYEYRGVIIDNNRCDPGNLGSGIQEQVVSWLSHLIIPGIPGLPLSIQTLGISGKQ